MSVPTLLSFSGGLSSAMMVNRLVAEAGSPEHFIITFANTGKEKDETLDFVHECDQRWGLNVVWLEYRHRTKTTSWISATTGQRKTLPADPRGFTIVDFTTASREGEPFEGKIAEKNFAYLPNVIARYCTGDLKVKVMKKYMQSLGYTFWNVAMGIRWDEPLRWGRYIQNTQKEPFHYILPLYEWELANADILQFWSEQPFRLQLKSYEGNCDLCFLKGKHKKIHIIRELLQQQKPEKVDWWIAQEVLCQDTFRKEYSYRELKHLALTQTEAFDDPDPEFTELEYPCHCNAD